MVAFAPIHIHTQKRLFDITKYYAMLDAGILMSDDRVELIHGEIIEMTPIGSRHAGYVKALNKLIGKALDEKVLVSVQDPLRLSQYSEPEPDLAILKPREDFYTKSHPTPKDVFFLVEVADTSVGYDYDIKLPMYAAAGITEVWVLDVNQNMITQHLRPDGNVYLDNIPFSKADTIKCKAIEFELDLANLFK